MVPIGRVVPGIPALLPGWMMEMKVKNVGIFLSFTVISFEFARGSDGVFSYFYEVFRPAWPTSRALSPRG